LFLQGAGDHDHNIILPDNPGIHLAGIVFRFLGCRGSGAPVQCAF
jgi:hypothetical protein